MLCELSITQKDIALKFTMAHNCDLNLSNTNNAKSVRIVLLSLELLK